MRSRNIKPSFFINEQLSEISFPGRILFIGLWCLADRRGVLKSRHRRIKAEIFPYDDVDVGFELSELAKHDLICLYEDDEGVELIQVTNFQKHQKPHPKESENGFPVCSAVKINGKPEIKTASPASYCSPLPVPCSLNEEGRDVPAPPFRYANENQIQYATKLLKPHGMTISDWQYKNYKSPGAIPTGNKYLSTGDIDKIVAEFKGKAPRVGAQAPAEFPADPQMTADERRKSKEALEGMKT